MQGVLRTCLSLHVQRTNTRKTWQQEPHVIILLLCGVALARIPLGPRAGRED